MTIIKFALSVILTSVFLIAANWLLAPALDVHAESYSANTVLDEIERELTSITTDEIFKMDFDTILDKLLNILLLLELLDDEIDRLSTNEAPVTDIDLMLEQMENVILSLIHI